MALSNSVQAGELDDRCGAPSASLTGGITHFYGHRLAALLSEGGGARAVLTLLTPDSS